MEDHYYAISDDIENTSVYGNMESSPEKFLPVAIEEKEGDDFLIELYRERRYLYDKSHRDFKKKQIKDNAWVEISDIMQQKNLGGRYTPEYCQIRCTSLRDQYSREKRNMKNDFKSGSSCSKRRIFPYFIQMSFLDNFIKRRSTFSNIERKEDILQSKVTETVTHEKNSNNYTDESDSEQQDVIKICQKRNISADEDASIYSQDTENLELNRNKHNKQKNNLKFKRRKITEPKNIDTTFTNVSNAIMTYLESSKENTINNMTTVDQSFVDYIRVHLQNIPEPEKSARKKMIFDVLIAPLPKM